MKCFMLTFLRILVKVMKMNNIIMYKHENISIILYNNIVSNNINAILVLIADKDIDYKYNLTNLKRKLHTSNVVEMNKFKIKDEFWYDLNHVGRDIYSEELLFRLENIHN